MRSRTRRETAIGVAALGLGALCASPAHASDMTGLFVFWGRFVLAITLGGGVVGSIAVFLSTRSRRLRLIGVLASFVVSALIGIALVAFVSWTA